MENKYQTIIDRYGKESQIKKLQEECLELALVISRMGCPTKDQDKVMEDFYEEIADVENLIKSCRLFLDTAKIDHIANEKLDKAIKGIHKAIGETDIRLPKLREVWINKNREMFQKQMIRESNIDEVIQNIYEWEFVCSNPHEDESFSYTCDSEWCKCWQ